MSLSLTNISAGYGRIPVIQSLSAQFNKGELYALIGPNGSGKSTLLKTLGGLLPCLNGKITGLVPDTPKAQQIAYMSQERIAHPYMRVKDIVALGREPYQRPFALLSTQDKTFIDSAINRAGITDLLEKPYGSLSGGQKARIHLARTLAVNAPILLVDEPIAALDPYYQLSILEILKNEAKCGRIVIAALHDLSLVRQFASQICVMDKGVLTATGTPKEALTPDILKDVFRIQMVKGQMQL